MKRLFLLVVLLVGFAYASAQEGADVSKICIASVVPDQQENVDAKTFQLLETRMEATTAANGFSTTQNGSFVMYPVINVLKCNKIEGGLRNYMNMEVEVTLFVCQQSTRAQYGSLALTLKGQGQTYDEAMRDAFKKITPSNSQITSWLDGCKKKIVQYFETNCDQMIASAYTLSKEDRYDEAFGLLETFPATVAGYNKIVDAKFEIYDECCRNQCSLLLAQAESAIAVQNYTGAAQILADISMDSPCSREATALRRTIDVEIKQAEAEEKAEALAAEERERAERTEIRKMEDRRNYREYKLKQARINAIQDIASAYYKSLPKVTYSNFLN